MGHPDSQEILKLLNEMNVTLARNTDSLEYHAKRCDMIEESVKLLRMEVRPLTRAHQMWLGASRVGAITVAVITALGALGAFLGLFKFH